MQVHYGGLHLFNQLAVKSRDSSQAEKKIPAAKDEQTKKKIQLISIKMKTFNHFE